MALGYLWIAGGWKSKREVGLSVEESGTRSALGRGLDWRSGQGESRSRVVGELCVGRSAISSLNLDSERRRSELSQSELALLRWYSLIAVG